MKKILFLALFIPFLSFAGTEVENTPEYLRATLTKVDSEFLYNALNVEVEENVKRVATQDNIAEVICHKGKLCVVTLSKIPAREQSTIFDESNGFFIALVDTFHEGERLFNAYNFDEIRGKNGTAKFFYSDDFRVLMNCIYKGQDDSYTCQFGIR